MELRVRENLEIILGILPSTSPKTAGKSVFSGILKVPFPVTHFLCSHHLPQTVQCGHRQHAAEQQQCEDVGVQQQGTSQALQCVEGQQAKGLLTQIQTGIEIPAVE